MTEIPVGTWRHLPTERDRNKHRENETDTQREWDRKARARQKQRDWERNRERQRETRWDIEAITHTHMYTHMHAITHTHTHTSSLVLIKLSRSGWRSSSLVGKKQSILTHFPTRFATRSKLPATKSFAYLKTKETISITTPIWLQKHKNKTTEFYEIGFTIQQLNIGLF